MLVENRFGKGELYTIDEVYKESKFEYKLVHFSKDAKIKIYRLKRIIEGKAYFQNDEIVRIKDLLNISDINEYFFKIKG